MGSGYDYVKRKALEQAKQQLQKLVSNNITDKNPFQLAKINNAQDEATLPDGSIIPVEATGVPGSYGLVAGNLIYAPEPLQYQIDSNNSKAYIAGWDGTNHYIRPIGSSQKWILPETGFDSRIDRSQIQIRIAADGKAVLIGGFYQDYPPFSAYSYQISSGTGGCQGNCISIPGYTYQTFAQYNIFVDFKLLTNQNGTTNFTYEYMTSQNHNLSADVVGYIPAPVSEGFGSAGVYRLFPTETDILYGSGNILPGEGPVVDVAGHPVDARFFPEVFSQFNWSQPSYDLEDVQIFPGPARYTIHYYGVGGDGNLVTSWSNIGEPTLPLLFNPPGLPIAIEDSNLTFVFAPNETGEEYYVDVVGDISFSTIYKVDYVRYQINSTFNEYTTPGPVGCPGNPLTERHGYQSQIYYQTFSYDLTRGILSNSDTNYPILYPYLCPFYVSLSDQWVINSTTSYGGVGEGSSSPYNSYSNWGESRTCGQFACDSCDPNFIPLNTTIKIYVCPEVMVGNPPFPCTYYNTVPAGSAGGGWGGGLLSDGPFAPIYDWAPNDTFQVVNWDGSGVTLLNPPLPYPSTGLNQFIPYFNASSCGCYSFPQPGPACSCFLFSTMVVDNSYRQYGAVGTGGINAYRFGRGNAAFEKLLTIRRGTSITSDSNNYPNAPSVSLFRLSSHSNQNRIYTAFRGTGGGTSLTYYDYDPFIPPSTSSGAPLTVQQFIDALNGDAIYEGTNVFYSASNTFNSLQDEPFVAYFWCSPYVPTEAPSFIDEDNISAPPDVSTDKVLSPNGSWPFQNNIFLNPIDSYIIDGYNLEGSGSDITEVIHEYTVQESGLTTQTKQVAGKYQMTNEIIKDYGIAIRLG